MGAPPIRILVDNNIFNISNAAEEVIVDPPPEVPFRNKVVRLRGVRGRDPLPPSHEQISCVPTIARLAKSGVLELYTYFGIDLEALGMRNFPSLPITNIFYGVTFHDFRKAIECSRLFDTDLRTFMTKGHKRNLCDLLLHIDPHTWSQNERIRRQLPEHEVTNLRRLDVLKDICANLSKKHFDDAIHLWHAELGRMQYFLSADCKFIRAIKQNNKLCLHCQLVSPGELLASLCIVERDPWPFDPDRLYTLDGRPVR